MTGYKDCKVVQLKDQLRNRHLQVSGLKHVLVRRLEEDDKKNSDISEGGDVDHHGTNNISKDNASSSPKANIPVTLQALDVRLKDYCLEELDQYSDCEMVQQLFKLVWFSKNIRPRLFGRELQGKTNQSGNENKAERSYDLNLKERAANLAIDCKETKMRDRSEEEWRHILSTQVFRSFIPSEDDKGYTDGRAHHCLACRCDFPSGSRPQVHSTRDTRKRRGETQRSDIRFCESTHRHFNLPNCDHQHQLAYHDDDSEVTGKNSWQTPDTTFGLCTYNLDERHWTEEWLQNDMVTLFGKKSLKKTMDGFSELREPYKISGTPVGIYSYPMFAFGFWEAKKEKDSSHENTIAQSARKLKSLLSWQRRIFDVSEVRVTSPTVWFFSSIGADWRVYGCSETKALRGDGFDYPMVHLWGGVSKFEEGALQLLSIVDLIRFWVDYTYKPLIGACISRLEAMKASKKPTPLNCTLWKLRIPIDREQTPWVFSQRRLKGSSSSIRWTDNLGVPLRGTSRGHSPSNRQSLRPENRSSPRREHRSPTPAGEQFVMREKDDFNWLLDRDPGGEDLILFRVSETGKIMRPAIIYSTSRLVGERQMPTVDWKDDDFKAVIADERRGHRPQIVSIFREDKQGRDYLWQCYRSERRGIRREVQFSIILPVNVVSYGQQNPESQDALLFEPLESLFRLHDLLGKIERAKKKWCLCGRLRNKYSPSMVQCRNALCNISWFHKECVNFPDSDNEDYEDEASWLCEECERTPEDERAYIELKPTANNLFARASHKRLHLARAIEKVWRKHDWPRQDEIMAKIDEVADKVDIIESAPYTIHKAGVRRNPELPELPRYWATSKDDPKKLILARSRKESVRYHEAVSDEEDENDDTKNVEDFEEETEDYTEEDDEDELSRPKTTEARGRSKSVDADQTIYVETDTATGSEDDTLVSAEGFHTPNKTAKSGHSRQKPAPKMKHV